MSLASFKKKSAILYGTNRSAKGPGGVWLSQGPFGHRAMLPASGPVGFSIQGAHRNVGSVGQDMKMSKSGTPYRGAYPIGWGGTQGTYPSAVLVGNTAGSFTGAISNNPTVTPVVQPVLNAQHVQTQGNQWIFVKPSVLSTHGMLDKKYRWAYYGVYPNYWVQPVLTGNQTDTSSQGMYLRTLASQVQRTELGVNDTDLYANHIVHHGPTLCNTRFTFNDMARNAPYTKGLYQPVTYDAYLLRRTRPCVLPTGPQKPFPYQVTTGSSLSAAGTQLTSVASGCGTANTYVVPPPWYTR